MWWKRDTCQISNEIGNVDASTTCAHCIVQCNTVLYCTLSSPNISTPSITWGVPLPTNPSLPRFLPPSLTLPSFLPSSLPSFLPPSLSPILLPSLSPSLPPSYPPSLPSSLLSPATAGTVVDTNHNELPTIMTRGLDGSTINQDQGTFRKVTNLQTRLQICWHHYRSRKICLKLILIMAVEECEKHCFHPEFVKILHSFWCLGTVINIQYQ